MRANIFLFCGEGRGKQNFYVFPANFFTAGVDLSRKNIYNKCVRADACLFPRARTQIPAQNVRARGGGNARE